MKKGFFSFPVFVLVFVLLFSGSGDLWDSTTGKSAGKIVDKDTGEGLPGVNVIVFKCPSLLPLV